MYISSDKLFLIGCGIALFVAILLTNLLSSIFEISYTTTFFVASISLIIMFGIGLMLISNKIWYKELTDYSFYRFSEVFQLYQVEVLKNKKTHHRFVDDYCAENRIITYPLDSQGNPIVSEVNKKYKIFNQIVDLLNNRTDLVNKYFHQESFRYPDYLSFIEEYNTTVISKNDAQLESVIKKPFSDNLEEKLAKVKAEILKYESGEKQPKHIGQRMFGYLLKANYLNAYNDEQRLEAWKEFTGLEQQPEKSFLRDPDYNKNETIKINQQLKQIEEFFYLIGLDIPITYHEKGMK